MTVMRRVIGASLANGVVQTDNKQSQERGVAINIKEDMLTEEQLIELEEMYRKI